MDNLNKLVQEYRVGNHRVRIFNRRIMEHGYPYKLRDVWEAEWFTDWYVMIPLRTLGEGGYVVESHTITPAKSTGDQFNSPDEALMHAARCLNIPMVDDGARQFIADTQARRSQYWNNG